MEERPFTKESVNNILQALEKNRRITTGFNNFRPNNEIPQPGNGNPYPSQPLAGKFMGQMDETV
tara:strand:+ start:1033 stop:1224 length:192 start_codon:yes stop_codon:yes gene_type:complete